MSTAAAIADSIAARAEQRHAEATAAYWAKVRECARPGAEVDPDEVAAWLEQTGHDPHQFQADIERVAARYEAAARLAAVPGLKADVARLRAELQAEGKKYDDAGKAWDEALGRLYPRIRSLEDEINHATNQVRGKLGADCPYDHLHQRDAEIGREVLALQTRERELLSEAQHRALGEAARCEADARATRDKDQRAELEAAAEAARQRAARYVEEGAEVRRKIAALNREREALFARMCEP